MSNTFQKLIAIDFRTLALFRVGLGVSILVDLCLRASDLSAHYSDSGAFPRSAFFNAMSSTGFLSLHFANGSVEFQTVLFALHALFAVMLLVGYRTRLATAVCWFLVASLHVRNPLLLHGGDIILRFLLLWSIFLPLGARASIDAMVRSSDEDQPQAVESTASLLILLQVVFVYIFPVYHRLEGAPWITEGNAVFLTLNADILTTDFGKSLLDYPRFLTVATYATLIVEMFGALLAFCPFYTSVVRCILVLVFSLMHLGFGLCLALETFIFIPILGWLLFIPSELWDKISWRADKFFPVEQVRLFVRSWLPMRKESPANLSRISNITVTTLFCLSFVALSEEAFFSKGEVFPEKLSVVEEACLLRQSWEMFAPTPPVYDGWMVVPGTLENGDQVDLVNGGRQLVWSKPKSIPKRHQNIRWTAYYWRLLMYHREEPLLQRFVESYARFHCRAWNENRGEHGKLQSVEIALMSEKIQPDYSVSPAKRITLFKTECPVDNSKHSTAVRILY